MSHAESLASALAGHATPDAAPVTLLHCVCGNCTFCPDGWHREAEHPCGCTPDCLIGDDGPCPNCGLHSLADGTCRNCGTNP
jgi:hypothetical protein